MFTGFIGLIITVNNTSDDISFYKNAKHVYGEVQSKTTDDKNEENYIIKIVYKVNNRDYYLEFEKKGLEAEAYTISQKINLFYNKENPNECKTNTKSVLSIYFIMINLCGIGIYGLYLASSHIYNIINNNKLIKSNNSILADFYKIKKKKSYYNTNNGIENYVLCKYNKDGKEYLFKSIAMYNDIGHYLKNKQIRVFVDNNNYNRYLVDINDINNKVVK